jgi:uncharacterized protein (TIGR03083 family)
VEGPRPPHRSQARGEPLDGAAAGPCKGATGLSFERLCAEIPGQSELLRATLAAADPATPVPSCPGWSIGALVRHLAGGQHWAAGIVETRATEPPPDDSFRDVTRDAEPPAAVLADELAASADRLATALRDAGPDAAVWTPLGPGTPHFWARRFAHETVVHRADGTLATGAPFTLEPAVALDALDEWMELGSLPVVCDVHPERRALLGPGRTVHLHATDTPPEAAAEWVVDLTGDRLAWRRAHEKSAVAVRGPLVELLLVVYGRRTVDDARVDVLGDRGLLDFWLAHVAFN